MSKRSLWCIWMAGLALMAPVAAQRRVDDRELGERLVVIVPLVGAGTAREPRRPLFVPTPEERDSGASGIVAYTVVLGDDKQTALVELVARDRKGLEAVLTSGRTDIKRFDLQKGSANAADIELEFRKVKKDFDFKKFKEGR